MDETGGFEVSGEDGPVVKEIQDNEDSPRINAESFHDGDGKESPNLKSEVGIKQTREQKSLFKLSLYVKPLLEELIRQNDLKERELELIKKNIHSRDNNTLAIMKLVGRASAEKSTAAKGDFQQEKLTPLEVMRKADADLQQKSALQHIEESRHKEEVTAAPKTEFVRPDPAVEPLIKERSFREAEPVNMERLKKEEPKAKVEARVAQPEPTGWQKFLKLFVGKN